MKTQLKQLALNPLVSGSFFLFSGGIVANVFNFIFNLLMSRNLKVEDYGSLISVISIITLLAVPAGAVTPTIVTIGGQYFADNSSAQLHSFYWKIFKALAVISLVLFVLFIASSQMLGNTLNIHDNMLLSIAAVAIFLSYFITLNYSFLQAKLSFRFLSVLNTISALAKVFVGFGLVLLGAGLNGAAVGVLFSYILPIIISTIFLKNVVFYKSNKLPAISYKTLIAFGIPSAIIIFCLNAFISVDILLVKNLFSERDAGIYAGISLVGRVIFYITAPIGTVMFPSLVNRFAKGENYKSVLYFAISLVGAASIGITIFYYLFPEFSVLFFLKRQEYLTGSSSLWLFGVFITLYSLVSLLSYYFLSIKQTKVCYVLLLGLFVQAGLIKFVWHANYSEVILSSIVVTSILLAILLAWFKFVKVDK